MNNSKIMFDIDEPNFIKWQRKCVCDFDNNRNTHSRSCKARFEEFLNETPCHHDFDDGESGLGGNRFFTCKRCGKTEIDD